MHDSLHVAGKPFASAFRVVFTSKNRWAWTVGAFAALMIATGNPGTAVAQQITGDIGFGGVFKPANNSFASAPLGNATSIDYNGNGIQDTGLGFVVLATGDFATLAPVGSFASLSDFLFNPLPAGGVNPLWSAGGFSFALDSIFIDTQNASTLSLIGTGTVSGNKLRCFARHVELHGQSDRCFFLCFLGGYKHRSGPSRTRNLRHDGHRTRTDRLGRTQEEVGEDGCGLTQIIRTHINALTLTPLRRGYFCDHSLGGSSTDFSQRIARYEFVLIQNLDISWH